MILIWVMGASLHWASLSEPGSRVVDDHEGLRAEIGRWGGGKRLSVKAENFAGFLDACCYKAKGVGWQTHGEGTGVASRDCRQSLRSACVLHSTIGCHKMRQRR